MMAGECKWCAYLRALRSVNLEEQLREYVEALPAQLRTEEAVYAQRLARCSRCVRCRNGLCGVCGCFVVVRAAKKTMDCPMPGGSRWQEKSPDNADFG